jgi:muramoyltetrapeptide carboxypeptidase LdcA involved in peptidoglycan recycling
VEKIYPDKLQQGDEVRIIAPSSTLKIIAQENIHHATAALESLGLKVTFAKNVSERNIFNCSSIESRIEDLHAAYFDKNVRAILTVIGGYNSNQLLQYIDYDLIRQNPKIFCGYSDITALQNAIYHKSGLVTYSGVHFSSFAMQKGFDYCREYFKKIFFAQTPIDLKPSDSWSDDAWFLDQENRTFHDNSGYMVINSGEAEGAIVGGNLSTFKLLHGTEYMPSLKDCILFIEANAKVGKVCVVEFDRDLQSLIHQPNFDSVKALVIGRFENNFGMDGEKLRLVINSKQELNKIPVIANADFGHTMPMFTFPIGGVARVKANKSAVSLELIEH